MTLGPILIVDDNEQNLKVARLALESEQFDVRTAGDGEQALHVVQTVRPQLILMDIQLPGLDGLEVTQRLKAEPTTRDIVVVAMTAYAMKGDKEKALAAGCDGYITKPLDPILLPAQVAEYLANRPGSRPAPEAAAATSAAPPGSAAHGSAPSGGSPVLQIEDDARRAREAPPILLVEDNPTTRKMFRVSLESAGYRVVEASDARSALAYVEQHRPALILQDLILPDMDGFELAREFRKRLGDAKVPILCVSGFLSRLDEARAFTRGFTQVLVKPLDPLQLIDVVNLHLDARPRAAPGVRNGRRVLVADDDPLQRKLAEICLSNAGYVVLLADDGGAALDMVRHDRPDAVVSDVLMPSMDGFALCLALRSDPELSHIPVILNSAAYVEASDRALAARVGASTLVAKTDGLENVIAALVSSIGAVPPPAPREPVELIEGERAQRALWQLKRQVQQNARLVQRTTLQEAQLAVLAGVAESLARNQTLGGVLGDVLASCLDMAGISKGALYLYEHDQHLILKHQIGFSKLETAPLQRAFGCEALFTDLAHHRKVVLIPSSAVRPDVAQQLIEESGSSSLLLVPVLWATAVQGVMLLGARDTDMTGEDALAFARVLGAQMGQAIGLAQSFSNLVASEQRYRTLSDHANDGISILSIDGVIRECNRRMADMLGYATDEIVGRGIQEFAPPGREAENERMYQQSIATGRAPPVELRRKDGTAVVVEFSTTKVEIGGETLVMTIGRDVTEQTHARAQLMVSDRMASMGALAAGVAHEINNPLAAVLANLEFAVDVSADLARESGPSPQLADLQDILRDTREAADRVREIAKDLKIFSRAEDEKRGAVDIRRVMESSLRMAWNEIRHRAQLVKQLDPVPPVEGNESRLGQVFLNLVINAAQAIPEGKADRNQITVVTGTDDRRRAVIEVRDTGAGIPPYVLKHLFTPFFTTKPAGVGTGLGLAICHRIVTGMGGEIAVESTPGEGSLFRVTLPAAHIECSPPPPARTVRPATRRGRVLLVDDDQLIVTTVSRVLGVEHDITAVLRAQDALDRMASGARYDVILCDVMMPSMTGIEFHERLSREQPDQAERIVFLTGGAFTSSSRTFLDAVPNLHIEKPFEVRSLRALINDRVR
jgi:PAS domain S-box-containing protein